MSDEFDENDESITEDSDGEDAEAETETVIPKVSKAWRSIERYREMKELKQHLDDYFYDEPGALEDLNL